MDNYLLNINGKTISLQASRAVAVTPNDSNDITIGSPAITPPAGFTLYVGGSGDLKVTTVGGDTVTYQSVSGFMPILVKRVWFTGTTASGIVAQY